MVTDSSPALLYVLLVVTRCCLVILFNQCAGVGGMVAGGLPCGYHRLPVVPHLPPGGTRQVSAHQQRGRPGGPGRLEVGHSTDDRRPTHISKNESQPCHSEDV